MRQPSSLVLLLVLACSAPLARARAQSSQPALRVDGFESGSLGAWTVVEDPPGQVSISERAAACGRYGLEIALGKNCQTAYVKDYSPQREAAYAARWRLDLGTLELPIGVSTSIFVARDDVQNRAVLRVRLKRVGERDYELLGEAAQEGSSAVLQMPWTPIPLSSGIPYAFSLQWAAASGPSANDGELQLLVGDATIGSLRSLANAALRVDSILVGAVGAFQGASGQFRIDGFASGASLSSTGYGDCQRPYVEPLARDWEQFWGVPYRAGQSHLRLVEINADSWAVQAMEGETWMAEGVLWAEETVQLATGELSIGLLSDSLTLMGELVGATGEASLVTAVVSALSNGHDRTRVLHDVTPHASTEDAAHSLAQRASSGGIVRHEESCPGFYTGPITQEACPAWFEECARRAVNNAIGNHPFLCGDLEAGALIGCIVKPSRYSCLALPVAALICIAAIADEVRPELVHCGVCYSSCMCSAHPALCPTGRLPVYVEVRRSSWVSCFNETPVRIAWRFEPPIETLHTWLFGTAIEGDMFVSGSRERFELPDQCPPFWNATITAALPNDDHPAVDGSWEWQFSFDELLAGPTAVIDVDAVYPGPDECSTYSITVRLEPNPPSLPRADIVLQVTDPVYHTILLEEASVPPFTDYQFSLRVPRGWIWSVDGRSVQQENIGNIGIDCGLRGGTDIQSDQLVVMSCREAPVLGPPDDCPECCTGPDCEEVDDSCPGLHSCEDCFYVPDAGAPPPSLNPNIFLCWLFGYCCNGCPYWDTVDVDCELVCVPCVGVRNNEGPEITLPGARVRMRSALVGHDAYDPSSRRVHASQPFYVYTRALCVMGMERVEYYVDDRIVETVLASAEDDFECAARIAVTQLAPGEHTLHVVGYGADGGRSSSRLWLSVETPVPSGCDSDGAGPVVTLTAPGNGAVVVPAPLLLQASAEDPSGVAMVAFHVGDLLLGSDSQTPFSITWNPPPGDWEIVARATDTCGNVAWSASRWIHVIGPCDGDGSVGSLTLTLPPDGLTIDAGCPVQVVAEALDPNGIARVELRANGVLLHSDTAAPYEVQYWTSGGGPVTFEARAFDSCGNSLRSAPALVHVDGSGAPCDCDAVLPSAVITSPANGLVVPRAGADIIVSAADNLGVDLVYFEITGQSPNPVLLSGPPWTYRFVPNGNANGSYSIRARAVDLCGQLSPWSASLALTAANQPPTPANDAATTRRNTPVTIQVTANDTDPNGDAPTIGAGGAGGIAQAPLNGTATRLDTNRFLYTPRTDYVGADSFVYRVYDGFGGAGTARVDVTVSP